ncbi:MAG: class I SAM-dependent methyltransferase [Alphaproteobacteria bacterium]|nr:class I SAM-dependent methyltransferase [Alphaproteobacteria bacterium]
MTDISIDPPGHDMAGTQYWDKTWKNVPMPSPFDPELPSLDDTFNMRIHAIFQHIFNLQPIENALEIGCAYSIWPRYLRDTQGIEADGIDYSRIGCLRTRAMWEEMGLKGTVHEADIFNPPETLQGAYDLVTSFGVMEHFSDTSAALSQAGMFLKPGGLILTSIPNLSGGLGFLQRWLDKEIYDIHIPLDREQITQAHEDARFEILDSRYLMSCNFTLLRAPKWEKSWKGKILARILSAPTKLIWLLESEWRQLPVSQMFSPYILVLARKK